MNVLYQKGDATNPQEEGNNIIVHICNDIGGWGKGVVVPVSKNGLNLKNPTDNGIKVANGKLLSLLVMMN